MAPTLPPPPGGSSPYELTHRGDVYGLGQGPSFFAIWHLEGGPPVETFERTQDGWERAWRRFQQLDRRERVAVWRRPTAAWILLHIVIGAVLWFAILMIEGMVLAAADRDFEEVTDATAAGFVVAFPLAMAGWILFVYLSSWRARWLSLVALLGSALAVAIVTGLVAQPHG